MSAPINVVVIPPKGPPRWEIVTPDEHGSMLKALQRLVGGPIEQIDGALPRPLLRLPGPVNASILVNEEGKFFPDDNPRNTWVQDYLRLAPGDYVAGTLVAYGVDRRTGDSAHCPSALAILLGASPQRPQEVAHAE